jgi:Mu-like prophage protein gp46
MTDRALDPSTRDYDGTEIDHLGNAIYLRIMTPRGSWWADPTLGSRLYELAREKDVERVRVLAQQYAQQALQPLLDAGRADAIEIVAQRQQGRLALAVDVTQGATRRLVELTIPVF